MIPDLFERERRDAPQLLRRLDAAWAAFKASYAGLSDAQLMKPASPAIGRSETSSPT